MLYTRVRIPCPLSFRIVSFSENLRSEMEALEWIPAADLCMVPHSPDQRSLLLLQPGRQTFPRDRPTNFQAAILRLLRMRIKGNHAYKG